MTRSGRSLNLLSPSFRSLPSPLTLKVNSECTQGHLLSKVKWEKNIKINYIMKAKHTFQIWGDQSPREAALREFSARIERSALLQSCSIFLWQGSLIFYSKPHSFLLQQDLNLINSTVTCGWPSVGQAVLQKREEGGIWKGGSESNCPKQECQVAWRGSQAERNRLTGKTKDKVRKSIGSLSAFSKFSSSLEFIWKALI